MASSPERTSLSAGALLSFLLLELVAGFVGILLTYGMIIGMAVAGSTTFSDMSIDDATLMLGLGGVTAAAGFAWFGPARLARRWGATPSSVEAISKCLVAWCGYEFMALLFMIIGRAGGARNDVLKTHHYVVAALFALALVLVVHFQRRRREPRELGRGSK